VGGRKSLDGGDGHPDGEDGSRLPEERSRSRAICPIVPTGASKHATALSGESGGLENESVGAAANEKMGGVDSHVTHTLLILDEHGLKHSRWKRRGKDSGKEMPSK